MPLVNSYKPRRTIRLQYLGWVDEINGLDIVTAVKIDPL